MSHSRHPPSDRLTARPMTEASYATFVENLVRDYAEEKVRSGDWTPDIAQVRSRKSIEKMLPEGLRTADNLLLDLTETATGAPVGHLWLDVSGKPEPGIAFIYDVEIEPPHRGRGLGRAALALAEAEALKHGYRDLRLFVSGFNTTAINLYRSSGYQVVNLMMRKPLESA